MLALRREPGSRAVCQVSLLKGQAVPPAHQGRQPVNCIHVAEKALQKQLGLRYAAQGRSDLEAAGTQGQPTDPHTAGASTL